MGQIFIFLFRLAIKDGPPDWIVFRPLIMVVSVGLFDFLVLGGDYW